MRCIDADHLIGLVKDATILGDGFKQAFIAIVRGEPTIEPERKKGEWVPDNNNYYEERFICSVCGRSYKVDTCMGKPMWDFCPCGADMKQ